ncbi:MAG TPA: hypothetical protein VMS79_02785 [Methanomassiliicoccales archaeon]|nr:hypothetical protein [Methanomassiliicoccales archaeon]
MTETKRVGLYRRFLQSHTTMSERFAEAFYGIIMVTGCTGMVSLAAPPGEAGVDLMLFTAILVNVLWGLIDGFTVVFGGFVDDTTEDEAVKALRAGHGSRLDVVDGFSDSLVGVLNSSDQNEIVEILRSAKGFEPKVVGLKKEDILRAAAIFSIDFFAVFWVVLPYVFVSDPVVAARLSFYIATFIMFYLGYQWAKYARMRRWLIGLEFSLFTIVLLIISYSLGGI